MSLHFLNLMGSAAEAEIEATYINTKESNPISTDSIDMYHPQPLISVQVDNYVSVVFPSK